MVINNTENSVGIVVLARMGSKRLKNKVLCRINHKYAIDILLDHVINKEYPVVIAIPDLEEDNILADIAASRGIECFRGYTDSPLHRLAYCADKYGFNYVVRVTSDDILIDTRLMFAQIRFALRKQHDYVYMIKCPSGIAGEVIKVSTLKTVIDNIGDKSVEFVSYELKNKYDTKEYMPGFEYQLPARLTLDYEEDLLLLQILYSSMVSPGTLDIINFLEKNRVFMDINKQPEITYYTCNYNCEPYIVECMQSIVEQDNFDNCEYIIVDDYSTDKSLDKIIEFYSSLPLQKQKRIKIVRNEKNIGLTSTCNKIIDMARGKYIVRVDSDDYIHKDYSTKMLEYIKYYNVSGVLSGYDRISVDNTVLSTVNMLMWHPACALFERWVVNEIRYRDDVQVNDGKYFYEDFRKHYKWHFTPEALWKYRQRPGQKTEGK